MELGKRNYCFEDELSNLVRLDFPLLYSKPDASTEEKLILKLKNLEQLGRLTFRLHEVAREFLPEFLRDFCFVDCFIKLDSKLTFLPSIKDTVGSGVDSDFLSASCHAIGEGLERHLGFLGGTKDSRPSLNSAYSLVRKEWVELNFNPFGSDPKENPFSAPCGQACHMVFEETFRNALGEILERNFIATVDESHDWFDITDSLVLENPHAKQSKSYWETLGYDFRVHVAKLKFGGYVAIASTERLTDCSNQRLEEKLNSSKFGISYRGSGADFGLEYAPMQAISELNRSAFFGPYLNIKSPDDCLLAMKSLSIDDYYFGYLERLRMGDWLARLARSSSTKATSKSLKAASRFSLPEVLQNLTAEYKEIYVIPFSTLESLGAIGLKIAIPGLNVSSISRLSL
jgi:hypothetical protein